MFAVVTAGKKLIRGSERIGIFSAISEQTNRSSLSLLNRLSMQHLEYTKLPETPSVMHKHKNHTM